MVAVELFLLGGPTPPGVRLQGGDVRLAPAAARRRLLLALPFDPQPKCALIPVARAPGADPELPGNMLRRCSTRPDSALYVTTSTRPPAQGRAPLTTRFAPAFRYNLPGLDTTFTRGCGLTRALPPLQRSSTSIPVTS